MDQFTLKEHLLAFKGSIFRVFVCYILFFAICYSVSDFLLYLVFKPLMLASGGHQKIIYTDLAEGFWAHIRVASFCSMIITYPFLCYQTYLFISPGLYKKEKEIIVFILALSPILFYLGCLFLYYVIIPNAWSFFVSYETKFLTLPVTLAAKIGEYLDLFLGLMFCFGVSFQLPVVIAVLSILGVVSADSLRKKRKVAIILFFVVAALFTPPDVLSQIALAIPLVLLYEFSILIIRVIEKRLNRKC